jgi:hypothetical protein
MPLGVVVGRDVQNDVHEGTNVQHRDRLNVEVGDDDVFVRQGDDCGLHGRGRCGSWNQFLGGVGLSFKIGGSSMLLIKELTGG